ncbi:MAG: DUF502 domain-containing protein [Chitinophagaceae bacterium]|nr:DUF502 domain-containing protein [Chitinophagaceae bacterium]
MKKRSSLKKLFQYFLQGLIILAPIIITIWAVASLFEAVDNILPALIERVAPSLLPNDEQGNPIKIPGAGFVLVMLIVIGVGYVSSSFIVGRMVELFDKILERTPGIKIIYSTVKDFVEAFAGNKRKFTKSVLVTIDGQDVWRVGFITQEELAKFGLVDFIAVYVPQSYAFAGHLYFVRQDRVRLLTDVSSTDAMKFAISGGVAELDNDKPKATVPPQ